MGSSSTWRPCRFSFDDPENVYDGETDGTTWNGFANVRVRHEVHEQIVQDLGLDPNDESEESGLTTIPCVDGWHDYSGGFLVMLVDEDEGAIDEERTSFFTWGDWEVAGDRLYARSFVVNRELWIEEDIATLRTAETSPSFSEKEAKANAALLQAAPDMLAALQTVAGYFADDDIVDAAVAVRSTLARLKNAGVIS